MTWLVPISDTTGRAHWIVRSERDPRYWRRLCDENHRLVWKPYAAEPSERRERCRRCANLL